MHCLCSEDDTHLPDLLAEDGKEYSAKLKGCVEGEEREKLWEELKNFTPVEGWSKPDDEEGAK